MSDLIHPGQILQSTLEHRSMTQKDVALRLGMTEKQVNFIINGKAPITPQTAQRLEYAVGVKAHFWNNLQKNYDQALAKLEFEEELNHEINLLKDFTCYNQLAEHGYVDQTKNIKEKLSSLLEFFGHTSLSNVSRLAGVNYRKSDDDKFNDKNICAWLRIGDIDANKMEVKPFNRSKLLDAIPQIRQLTQSSPSEYSPNLVNILAECGIALIYTPYLTQTYINGASRWLSPTRALIQLSTRHKSNDALWFTLMHELGHILKHGKKDEFIDFASQSSDTQEAEADSYALETLIPANEYKSFVMQQDFSKENIVRASNIMGIGSDILAGRLAHDNFINWASKQQLSIKIELKKPVKA